MNKRLDITRADTVLSMCEGKDRLTHEQARKIARRMSFKARKVEPYHCLICRDWHVGRPMGTQFKGRARK